MGETNQIDHFVKEDQFIDIRIKFNKEEAGPIINSLLIHLKAEKEIMLGVIIEQIYFSGADAQQVLKRHVEDMKESLDHLYEETIKR